MSEQQEINLRVNGADYSGTCESRRTLVDFLRDDLELTGTHVGCEHGVCGACTVLLNGEPVRSCLMLAVQANGASIETIEGLGTPDDLSPLQDAFRQSHSFQCGFCTPGFMMTSLALLRENPNPSEAEIRHCISGNLCRCTGYQSIVEGVKLAAKNGLGRSSEVVS
ncbi:MAG: (2Fe-2S)-binding protein [Actinobacteria bacterium]|nr:(2Fe-2S)-binding protein [Actinomycetota bacterium]